MSVNSVVFVICLMTDHLVVIAFCLEIINTKSTQPPVLNEIKKHALILVKKCVNGELCETFLKLENTNKTPVIMALCYKLLE